MENGIKSQTVQIVEALRVDGDTSHLPEQMQDCCWNYSLVVLDTQTILDEVSKFMKRAREPSNDQVVGTLCPS